MLEPLAMPTLSLRTVAGAEIVWLPGGVFHMGSDDHYPEEAPVHRAAVEGFWIDRTPVTATDFARFVAATGYVTLAERVPAAEDYPGTDPAALHPASLVFAAPGQVVDMADWRAWWRYAEGASWRHPEGPGSHLDGRWDHPVVHVAHADAAAYAAWAGKALPTEAEWEFAARGGLDRAEFAWGDALVPGGVHRANTWQGRFPIENLAEDGHAGTSPVTAFPPNGYGLFDMIGNVWEWTTTPWRVDHRKTATDGCCAATAVRSGTPALKVVKGGSHLCAPNHCRRYRPAARQPQSIDTSLSHIGFRCVLRGPGPNHRSTSSQGRILR